MRCLRALGVCATAVLLTACSDQGPESAPGTLTAALVSPNGAEGAAVVTLRGQGLGATTGLGDVVLFRLDDADVTTMVLVSPSGGSLSFRAEVADTTRPPTTAVLQIAGPDDELRATLSGYRLEWVR
ncbi:MAG: hypothetical protein ABL963_01095 [Longimicrobiales bacterium]